MSIISNYLNYCLHGDIQYKNAKLTMLVIKIGFDIFIAYPHGLRNYF